MSIAHITKGYFIGVGGIGVSAIIRLFADKGIVVTGSDVTLPEPGSLPDGQYFEGVNADHVPRDASILIYSPAVPRENIERARARELGIPELSYPEALALVTKEHATIAISGTHGKSTTTAIAGKLFQAGGLDASVIVGAEVPEWDHNYHNGKGDMFIVEACEYRRSMMQLRPQAIILTNLELDHPDYYHDLADVKSAFSEYINKLSSEDLLIMNNDDANIRDITKNFDAVVVRYGVGEGADLVARNVKQNEYEQSFDLVWKGTSLGNFTTTLPGLYNVYNILAATAVYLAYGGTSDALQSVFSNFHGVGRRFEVVGTLGHATIISDYAHHPTALRAVVSAAIGKYQNKKILTVFRPHHRERTIKLMNEFVEVMLGVPQSILIEIYDVAGREDSTPVSSRNIITNAHKLNPSLDIVYAADINEAEEMIRRRATEFDVILIIGAGDTDQLAKRLIH